MSSHLGQKILTVLCPGTSEVPTGRHACPSHRQRGHRPKSQFLNFSSMAARPRVVTMNLRPGWGAASVNAWEEWRDAHTVGACAEARPSMHDAWRRGCMHAWSTTNLACIRP